MLELLKPLQKTRVFLSGEGGIRTLGSISATPVFETAPSSPQPLVIPETSAADAARLAFCLAPPTPADPDLAGIITAWPDLPPHIKAAVLTLVAAVPHP